MIEVEVWDRDEASDNDIIGAGSLALASVFAKHRVEEWVPLHYKGKGAGSILVELEWNPDVAVTVQVGQMQPQY